MRLQDDAPERWGDNFRSQLTPSQRVRRNEAVNQALWLLLPFAYACLFSYIRNLGTVPLLIALGMLASFGMVYGRQYFQKPLMIFSCLAVIYIGLSYLGIMDRGITLMFSREAIPQQSAYAVIMPFVVAAFAVYHEKVEEGNAVFLRLETVVFIIACAAKLYDFIYPTAYYGQEAERQFAGIAQLVNTMMIMAFIFVRRILQVENISWFLRFFCALILLITSSSAQAGIVLFLLLVLMILPELRLRIIFLFLCFFVIAPIVGAAFAQSIWRLDPNTGIRLFFWHDAVKRWWESGGVGVGFGTETIRPIYDLNAADVTILTIDDPGFIYVGSHNAFVDALYRMGVLGFLLLSGFILRLFVRVVRGFRGNTIFDCWVTCALVTNLMVNVGLASINLFFGSAFLIGWLVYRITQADAGNDAAFIPRAQSGACR
ncbi:O-antigen ligase family protein [Sphingomonas sp. S6]|uniref:O-antigen ligase family protein n=1 Tax=Sphingomonas sp. S6 TaxID=3368600 RepID=UPI00373F979E